MTFLIRDELEADRDAVRAIHGLAFGGGGEGKLVDDLRQTNEIAVSLVAEQAGQIIGHVLFSKLQAPMRAVGLAPIGVHPGFQKQGVGTALIGQGIQKAQQEKWDAIFVLGDPVYYSRFGFDVRVAKAYTSPYAGEHFMILTLATGDIPKTGEIVYPAAFSQLD